MNKLKSALLAFSFSLTFLSCTSTKTALFDQYSYQKTTALKVELNNLMDKATTPYTQHEIEIKAILLDVEKLKMYEKNKPHNEITFALWEMLTDDEKNLLSGFFKRWQTKETLSPIFIEESKKQVLEALDLIIRYEIKKDTESKNILLELIANQ